MAKLKDLGEVISTDLLSVGGGIGGLVAAIKAKEESPKVDILLAEKQTVGWSGCAPCSKGRGGLWVKMPDDEADKILEYHVKNIGCYLEDQELLYSFILETYGAIEQLAEWGVNIAKDAEGKIATSKHIAGLWSGTGGDRDQLFPLRTRASN